MRVYIIRHGTASHLTEDLNRKVNHKECLQILNKWNKSILTPLGEKEIAVRVADLNNKYSHIFYSPMERTKQTALEFLKNLKNKSHYQPVTQLSEIYISPPRLPGFVRLKIKNWVYLCVFKAIYTGNFLRYFFQAQKIIHLMKSIEQDVVIISHQARIFSLIVYAFFSPAWKIRETDIKPAGMSIIEKKQ